MKIKRRLEPRFERPVAEPPPPPPPPPEVEPSREEMTRTDSRFEGPRVAQRRAAVIGGRDDFEVSEVSRPEVTITQSSARPAPKAADPARLRRDLEAALERREERYEQAFVNEDVAAAAKAAVAFVKRSAGGQRVTDLPKALARPTVAWVSDRLTKSTASLEHAAEVLGTAKGEAARVRAQVKLARERLGDATFHTAAAEGVLQKYVAAGYGGATEGARYAIARAREEVAGARELLSEVRDRASYGGVRTALSELRHADRRLAEGSVELSQAQGRGQLWEGVEEPAAPEDEASLEADTEGLTEEDLKKLGTDLPANGGPQMMWMRNDGHPETGALAGTHRQRAMEQGLISQEQQQRSADAANGLLPSDEVKKLEAGDLLAAAKQAGIPLEKLDVNQLQQATRLVNTAKSPQEQRDLIAMSLDNLSVAANGKAPELSRQDMVNLLWAQAKIPGHALTKLKDSELKAKLHEITQAANSPGKHELKVGSHKVKLQVSEDGQLQKTETKKPSVLSKIGGALKKVGGIALTVASFIPVTAPFARAAQAGIALYKAIKNKSLLGVVSAAAGVIPAVGGVMSKVTGGVSKAFATVSRVADSVSKAAQGVASIKRGGIGGIIGGVAGIAGAAAGAIGEGAKGLSESLQKTSERLQKVASGAGAVEGYVQANRAVTEAKRDLERALASGDPAGIQQAREALKQAEQGKRSALFGGVSTAAGLAASSIKGGLPGENPRAGQPGARSGLKVGLDALSRAASVARGVNDKDWASVGADALGMASSLKQGTQARETFVDENGNVRERFDLLQAAANVADAGNNYRRTVQAEKAADQAVKNAQSALEAAKKSGDPVSIRQAEKALQRARDGAAFAAIGTFNASTGLSETVLGTVDTLKATRAADQRDRASAAEARAGAGELATALDSIAQDEKAAEAVKEAAEAGKQEVDEAAQELDAALKSGDRKRIDKARAELEEAQQSAREQVGQAQFRAQLDELGDKDAPEAVRAAVAGERKRYEEAVAAYEAAKRSGDPAKLAEAQRALDAAQDGAIDRIGQAQFNAGLESVANSESVPEGVRQAAAEEQAKLERAAQALEAARRRGDPAEIERARADLEAAQVAARENVDAAQVRSTTERLDQELAQLSDDSRVGELVGNERARVADAQRAFEEAKKTGDADALRAAEERLDAARQTAIQNVNEALAAAPKAETWKIDRQTTTVWEISQKTGVPVDEILQFNAANGNRIDPARLREGQEILVPTDLQRFQPKSEAEITAMQRAARSTPQGTYEVKKGATLTQILRENPHLTEADVRALNPQLGADGALYAGQRLNIPAADQIRTTQVDGKEVKVIVPRELLEQEAASRKAAEDAADRQLRDGIAQMNATLSKLQNTGTIGNKVASWLTLGSYGAAEKSRDDLVATVNRQYEIFMQDGKLNDRERQALANSINGAFATMGEVKGIRGDVVNIATNSATGVVVGVAAVATGGTALPVLLPTLGLVGAGTRTVSKSVMEGTNYTVGEWAQDIAIGGVQGLTSTIGAGAGGVAVGRVVGTQAARVLGTTGGRVVGGAAKGVADNLVGNFVGGGAEAAVTVDTWKNGVGQGLRTVGREAVASATSKEGLLIGAAGGGVSNFRGGEVDVSPGRTVRAGGAVLPLPEVRVDAPNARSSVARPEAGPAPRPVSSGAPRAVDLRPGEQVRLPDGGGSGRVVGGPDGKPMTRDGKVLVQLPDPSGAVRTRFVDPASLGVTPRPPVSGRPAVDPAAPPRPQQVRPQPPPDAVSGPRPATLDPAARARVEADLDRAYQQAAVAHPKLKRAIDEIALSTNGTALVPEALKGRQRAMEKVLADYGGDASKITDLSRGSITFDSVDDARAALRQLEERFEVVRVKDRFAKPGPDGYRDMLVNLRIDGAVVEVQLHHKGILEVKNGPGHHIYEQVRSIEAAAKLEGRPLSAAELGKIRQLQAESARLYEAALAPAPKASVSSTSGTGTPRPGATSSSVKAAELAAREVSLRDGSISFQGSLGGGNSGHSMHVVEIVDAAGTPRKGVFHVEFSDGPSARFVKDRAASHLNRMLDLDNGFPATVERVTTVDGELRRGFVQEWAGETFEHAIRQRAAAKYGSTGNDAVSRLIREDPLLRTQVEQAFVERMVYGDGDSHALNFVIEDTPDGPKVKNVDLDYAFSEKPVPEMHSLFNQGVNQRLHLDFSEQPLSAPLRQKLADFVERVDTPAGRAQLAELGLTHAQIDAMLSRARWLSERGQFPKALTMQDLLQQWKEAGPPSGP